MRILDLDLDFFLNSIAHDQSSGGSRLSEKDFTQWASDKVREFLEIRCGLSTQRRIPGKYVTHHHEAFYWWRELIKEGKLTTPFEVVHVDAHADLGAGMFGHSMVYVGLDLLHHATPGSEADHARYAGVSPVLPGIRKSRAIAVCDGFDLRTTPRSPFLPGP